MRVGAVQLDVHLGAPERNLDRMIDRLRDAAGAGAELVIFPECAVTGYCFEEPDEAASVAQSIPGPATDRFCRACAELGCFALFGTLELASDRIFNTAVLVGPRGIVGTYRKIHLPLLGADRFVSYGDRPFAVHTVGDLRLGINICYDANFPEAARCLALLGADLIALPTNWVVGPGSFCTVEHVIHARALDSKVYYCAVNRVGTERGFTFFGRSKIVDPAGQTIACLADDSEATIYADIDVALARAKHVVRVPGKHESHRFADRHPEMYGLLTERHNLQSPWRR
jgi:predicted amidohydrolase